MARNAQVRRQWRLWRLLATTAVPLSAEELARELRPDEVSPRTIRRDLEVLREVGVPIRDERRGRELRYWARGDGPDLRLDGETLLALKLALGLLRPFEGTAVGESVDQLQRQLEARVPPRLLAHFGPLADGVAVRPDAPPTYASRESVFAPVREALARSVVLEIDYEDVHSNASRRRVHPQQLVYGPLGLYLLALDESRDGELRTFRLERIQRSRPRSERAQRLPAFDSGDYLAGSLGIHSPEHGPRRFALRVHTPEAARRLRENPWHPSQAVIEEPSGTFLLTLELTSSRELVPHVLAFGADLEVLEPRELRRELRAILAHAERRYWGAGKASRRSRSVRNAG